MTTLAALVNWPAVAAMGMFALAIMGAVVRLVLLAGRIANAVDRHSRLIDQNARHLDSLMNAQWQTITRVATTEDFLRERLGYRPPVLMPNPPADDGHA